MLENDLSKGYLSKTVVPDNIDEIFEKTADFRELMMMYNCAIREVRTKLEVLNDELSITKKRNPIEHIKTRIKEPQSIVTKLKKKGCPITVDSVKDNLNDVAGLRVICAFIDDIYKVADMLIRQDDITLIQMKDYIKKPKMNGYRSLHLILEVPVFFSERKESLRVEVQIRTIAMNFWASLEHQLKYKKNISDSDSIVYELRACADVINRTDHHMQSLRDRIIESNAHLDLE